MTSIQEERKTFIKLKRQFYSLHCINSYSMTFHKTGPPFVKFLEVILCNQISMWSLYIKLIFSLVKWISFSFWLTTIYERTRNITRSYVKETGRPS